MDAVINNAADLKLEIIRLKQQKTEQEIIIKQHFNSPGAILGTVASLFHRSKSGDHSNLFSPGHDIMGWLSKFILPATLNKTLFRRSGFVVRALVRLLSRRASHFVNDKSVGSFWDKIKDVIPKAVIERISPQKAKPRFNLLSPRKAETKKIKHL